MWKSFITILCATGTVLAANEILSVSVLPSSEDNVKTEENPSEGVVTSECPNGFVSLGDRDCYFISLEVNNWLDAQFFCADKNSTLAELSEMGMNNQLRDYLINQEANKFERWIGARYDWKSRAWEWGITGRNYTYDGFGILKTASDRVDEKWHCVVMNPARQYNWAARICVDKKHFICHIRKNSTGPILTAPSNIHDVVPPRIPKRISACPNGFVLLGKRNCFYVSPGVANWLDAQFFCQDRNATLAELPKKHLNRKLKSYLLRNRSGGFESWIGARYNWKGKVWEWGITGQNITYDGFSKLKSEINRVDEKWHCAVMNPARKYNWAARSCIENKHYICHKPANLRGKKGRRLPNRQRGHRNKNRKGNSMPSLTDMNEVLPFSEREFRTIKRSNKERPKKYPHNGLTRWAPGTMHSDRLKPVRSNDPAVPEQWVSRKQATIMTSKGEFVESSREESLSIPPSPSSISETLSESMETETGNMLTQFGGGHMFL